MNTDSTTFSNLQSLLGGNSDNGVSLIDTDAIIKAMLPIAIILTVVSVIIAILYVVNIVQHLRVSRATIETRDILREMNERDKARNAHTPQETPIADRNTVQKPTS